MLISVQIFTVLNIGLLLINIIIALILINRVLRGIQSGLLQQQLSKNAQEVRWSAQAKPLVGGTVFATALAVGLVVYVFLFKGSLTEVQWGLVAATFFGYLLGLIDDNRNISAAAKFGGQLLCAHLIYFSGNIIVFSTLPWLNYMATIFWVVALMNSINMIDNMDGIAGTIALFAALALCGCSNDASWQALLVAVVGGLLGFLYYNWHPSKVYMGDSGSQFLGAFLGAASIALLWNVAPLPSDGLVYWQVLCLPLLLFTPCLVDTLTVTGRRLARGQSPFVGGRDHTTHRLALSGLKDNQVAWIFVVLSAISAAGTYFLHSTQACKGAFCWTVFAYFALVFGIMQWFYRIKHPHHSSRL